MHPSAPSFFVLPCASRILNKSVCPPNPFHSTADCGFATTPYYVVEVVGERFHWQLLGANSVSHPTPNSMRVTVLHPSLKGLKLLQAAKKYKWRVSWVGETGNNAGQTTPGASGWKQASSATSEISAWTIYLQVRVCLFVSTNPPNRRADVMHQFTHTLFAT